MLATAALRPEVHQRRALLESPEGRRALTKHDPLLFALTYFPEHLRSPLDGSITVCDFHLDLLDYAKGWAKPVGERREHRAVFIAPRSSGKSTWIFLLLPMWAAAHGHRKFVAAFSDSETQAAGHLATFKMELKTNERLRADFPELVEGMKLGNSTRDMMDNRNQIMQANGFIFMAKGADSASLGMKVGSKRPDVLLFDDIEPGESNYSDHLARQRRETLQADLFALNQWAVVAIVGTTTMPNSLIDQMRKVGEARRGLEGSESQSEGLEETLRATIDPELKWVLDENISVHYWPVILTDDDGDERSLWPEVWPLDKLNEERGTRAFAKNMMNRPVSTDGGFWGDEDIQVISEDELAHRGIFFRHTVISVDPAVTQKKTSDYTGIAVVSVGSDNLVYVRLAEQLKSDSEVLKARVSDLANRYNPSHLIVETNQGGNLWKQVFDGIPAKYVSIHQKEKKETRAAQAYDFYAQKKVKHTGNFYIAEEQMLAFPKAAHDDVVDAIVTGVLTFKRYARTNRVGVTTKQYVEV